MKISLNLMTKIKKIKFNRLLELSANFKKMNIYKQKVEMDESNIAHYERNKKI